MDRVLHQVRAKEEQMHRSVDHATKFKFRCGELEVQVEHLLRERAGMSEEFTRLHDEVGEEVRRAT